MQSYLDFTKLTQHAIKKNEKKENRKRKRKKIIFGIGIVLQMLVSRFKTIKQVGHLHSDTLVRVQSQCCGREELQEDQRVQSSSHAVGRSCGKNAGQMFSLCKAPQLTPTQPGPARTTPPPPTFCLPHNPTHTHIYTPTHTH